MEKRKKYIIIISTIIQLIASVWSLIQAKVINEGRIAELDSLPEVMRERMASVYQNTGAISIVVLSIICILIDLILIYLVFKDKASKKKGLIIFLFAVTLFTASISVVELIAIVDIIIVATIKADKTNVKKEIPKIEKEKVDKKKIILAIALIVYYFLGSFLVDFVPGKVLAIFVVILFYCSLIAFSILIFKDKFMNDAKLFVKNFGTYVGYIVPKYVIFFIIYAVISFICIMITKSRAANQELIEQIPMFISFPLAVIYAPIVEETLFRGCLRRLIANEKVFIVISALAFGLLHTFSSETEILNLFVTAIPYACLGGFFAYLYTKTNNLLTCVSCHFVNNLFAMIVSIITAGLIM